MKQRDFESKPFEVTSGPDCRLHIVGAPGEATLSRKGNGRTNPDGQDAVALQVLRDNPKLALRKVTAKLKELGITRSKDWVSDRRYDMMQENGGLLPGQSAKDSG